MDRQTLSQIGARFGTPCFVFDEAALRARMRRIKAIVGDSVHLCYSIKANPFLISAMKELTELMEVCSPGELVICEDLGVAPETILLSGVNKTLPDILDAIRAGVTRFTAESPLHARLLSSAAAQLGVTLSVLLRLTAGSQFGMDISDLTHIVDHRDRYPGLLFEGIHFFSGTQRKKLEGQRKELAMLDSLMDTLKSEHGFATRRLEYGPGLYYPYFVHEDMSDTLGPLRELAPDLRRIAERTELTCEMGRFFASECGTYLTTVMDTKTCCGANYAIVDGGIHHVNYLGGNMGMRLPHIEHLPGPNHTGGEAQDWALCGSLCTTADVLVRKASFSGLAQGDLLAFGHIGAYSVTEGPALFLSRDLPKIVLHDETGNRLARDTIASAKINQANVPQANA